MSYVCPMCMTAKGLWRGVDVPGWEAVDADLKPIHSEREVDWSDASDTGAYGCGECNWEGFKGDLITLGLDDKPLPKIAPGQMKIDSAASS